MRPPKRKPTTPSIAEVSTESSDPEVEDEPPDKFAVCVDRVNQTPVIGKKNLKTGIFTPCSNFSLEIHRFCDGAGFSAPCYKISVHITSEPRPKQVLIPDNIETKKQLTSAITSSLSAPTYCQLTKNEFTTYYGDVVKTFIRKGLPKAKLIGYTGWQVEDIDIQDLQNTCFCVLSEELTLGYDGNPTTNHKYIFSSEIVNKYNRKKENKLNMLLPISLEVISLEKSKKQFQRLFDVGPEGAGAESFKLLLVAYQAQQAAPIVKLVEGLDSTPMICLFGEHGSAKTTSNELCVWAYSDKKLQFNASTPSATLEVLSTSSNFTFYVDDLNNLDKEDKFTAPFYDEKGSATQTGGFSKPRAKLVWSTNEFGKRSRKVAGRSVMLRLRAWLNEMDPASRVNKLRELNKLRGDDRRPLQFTLSLCQKATTEEFMEIYEEQLKFVDENFPPGLDPREKNLWGQLLAWFEVYGQMFPEYFNRLLFNQHLHDVVIPDIHMWNPSAGPSITLDEFICAGIDELMANPDAYYRVLRSIRLGKKGVYISRQSFPHVQKISIADYDEVVKRIGGIPNNTQKLLRPDCIDSKLVITKSSADYNAWSHRTNDIPLSSIEESTLEKIKSALAQPNRNQMRDMNSTNSVGYSPAKDDVEDTIADLTTKLKKLEAEKLLMAKKESDGSSSFADVDSDPTTSDEESDESDRDVFGNIKQDFHQLAAVSQLEADVHQLAAVSQLEADVHQLAAVSQLEAEASPTNLTLDDQVERGHSVLHDQKNETADGEASPDDVEPKAVEAVEPEPSKTKENETANGEASPDDVEPKAVVIEAALEPEPSKTEECKVCSEPGPLVQFEPCGHMEVCTECAVRIKKCLNCKITVSQKKLKTLTNEKKISLEKSALQKNTWKEKVAICGSKNEKMGKISSTKKRKEAPSDSPLNSQNVEEKLSQATAASNKKNIGSNERKINDKIPIASTSSATKVKKILTKPNPAQRHSSFLASISRGKAIVNIASKQKENANVDSKQKENANVAPKQKQIVNANVASRQKGINASSNRKDSTEKENVKVDVKQTKNASKVSDMKKNANKASCQNERGNIASTATSKFAIPFAPNTQAKRKKVEKVKMPHRRSLSSDGKTIARPIENNKMEIQRRKRSLTMDESVQKNIPSIAKQESNLTENATKDSHRKDNGNVDSTEKKIDKVTVEQTKNVSKVSNRKENANKGSNQNEKVNVASTKKENGKVAVKQIKNDSKVSNRKENANKASSQKANGDMVLNQKVTGSASADTNAAKFAIPDSPNAQIKLKDVEKGKKSHKRSLSSGGETIAKPLDDDMDINFRKRSLTMGESGQKDIPSIAKQETRRSDRKRK